jgi:hypothetical protein
MSDGQAVRNAPPQCNDGWPPASPRPAPGGPDRRAGPADAGRREAAAPRTVSAERTAIETPYPPVTPIACAVIPLASSLARNTAVAATSSGAISRRSATCRDSSSTTRS